MAQLSPRIEIHRDEVGMVSAIGADSFAILVLHRAGFEDTGVFHNRWQRLPFDLGQERENELACQAATVLSANGYEVGLDRDLRVGVSVPVTAMPYAGKPGLALSRLVAQLESEDDEDIQRLQRFVLAPPGVAQGISSLLQAVSVRVRKWAPTSELGQQFASAAEIVEQAAAALHPELTGLALPATATYYTPYAADPITSLQRYTEAVRMAPRPWEAAILVQNAVLETRDGALDQLHEFLQVTAKRCSSYTHSAGHSSDAGQRAEATARAAGASAVQAAQLLRSVPALLDGTVTSLGRLQVPPHRPGVTHPASSAQPIRPSAGPFTPPPRHR